MIGGIIVTHGGLAAELVSAARRIVPELAGIEAVVLDWNESPEAAQNRIRSTIQRVDDGHGVIVMTDMFGGTPSNLCLPFLDPARVEIVSGVNLPMAVKLATRNRTAHDPAELARELRDKGRRSIDVASDVLSGAAPRVSK